MDLSLNNIKKLVEKWIKWSGEQQLKLFMKNKKTKNLFQEALSWQKKY